MTYYSIPLSGNLMTAKGNVWQQGVVYTDGEPEEMIRGIVPEGTGQEQIDGFQYALEARYKAAKKTRDDIAGMAAYNLMVLAGPIEEHESEEDAVQRVESLLGQQIEESDTK